MHSPLCESSNMHKITFLHFNLENFKSIVWYKAKTAEAALDTFLRNADFTSDSYIDLPSLNF